MKNDLKRFFRKLVNLREGSEEKAVIIENVKDDADFSSARFWTLVFAIGACSVGLNINSIPVIIGAMLISPLMGPIVSMGLALSVYDWGLMRRSFRNLLTLTAISIIISAIYFSLSPITNAQSELLARTQPTIFDVLIAIFGGMAGFIGVSRARHNNVIPGVAIATALMPPLCTVGYGIGTLQPQFIFGAFYLFLINSIFICLSSLVVASYLKLPKREYPDEAQKKSVNRFITAVILIITVPAVYTAYTFVQQNNFSQHASDFVRTEFENEGYVVIYQNFEYDPPNSKIELAFLSETFSEDEIVEFESSLMDYKLGNTELVIRNNGFALSEDDWQLMLQNLQNEDERFFALEARMESERKAFESPERLLEEARAINGKVGDIAFGALTYAYEEEVGNNDNRIVILYAAPRTSWEENEKSILTAWLRERLVGDVMVQFAASPTFELATTTPETASGE